MRMGLYLSLAIAAALVLLLPTLGCGCGDGFFDDWFSSDSVTPYAVSRFDVRPRFPVRGIVIDQLGRPIADVEIVAGSKKDAESGLAPGVIGRERTVSANYAERGFNPELHGTFNLSVEKGDYILVASKEEYRPTKIAFAAPMEQDKPLTVVMTPIHEPAIGDPVPGFARDDEGAAVQGVRVETRSIKNGKVIETKISDAAGHFTIRERAGRLRITAFKDGYVTADGVIDLPLPPKDYLAVVMRKPAPMR